VDRCFAILCRARHHIHPAEASLPREVPRLSTSLAPPPVPARMSQALAYQPPLALKYLWRPSSAPVAAATTTSWNGPPIRCGGRASRSNGMPCRAVCTSCE
jgi:hypothetical protein